MEHATQWNDVLCVRVGTFHVIHFKIAIHTQHHAILCTCIRTRRTWYPLRKRRWEVTIDGDEIRICVALSINTRSSMNAQPATITVLVC